VSAASSAPVPPPELAAWRADTPATAHRVHLNNAGAALMPRTVQEAVVAQLQLESDLGGYEAGETRRDAVVGAYADVGRLLGTEPRNLAFTQNSTVAFAQALSAFDFEPGDVILTSLADYASNQIMYLALARRRGIELVRAPDTPAGGIDPDAVRALIAKRRPALVALTWIPTNSGLVQPAELVGEMCRDAGVPYLIDACQAVGQLPVDVNRLHCDYLAATSRKFIRGPRGIGFLYVSDEVLRTNRYPLYVDLHGATWNSPDAFTLTPDARRFESWEVASAMVLGLGAAARYALDVGLETARDRSAGLAAYTRERLAGLPGVRVLDRGADLCAIVTAAVKGWRAEELKLALRARGINTSATEREDAVIDMDQKGVSSVLRISPHYYNTAEEIDAAVGELENITAGR
jgi:selenocysteine lyase/cysteine desulfurase